MTKVKIENQGPETIAYIEHTGPFDKLPFEADYARLYAWAREHRLRPGMRPLAQFLDPPQTPPERLRSRIAITVHGEAKADAGVLVEELPAREVASIKHNGPARDYGKTYAALYAWTQANGYEWAGPSLERYAKRPKVRGGELVIAATVQVPVRRRPSP